MLLRLIYLSGFIQLEDSGQQLLVREQTRSVRRVTRVSTPSSSAQGAGLSHQQLKEHKSPAHVNPNLQKSQPRGSSKPLFSHAKQIKAQ